MHLAPFISISLLCSTISFQALAQDGPPKSNVRVDPIRLETVENLREVTGELRASRRAQVATQESGRVIEIPFQEGTFVSKNQILATLDSELATLDTDRAQAQVHAAQALVLERQAQLEQAQRNLARLEDLAKRSSASQTEVDDARTQVAMAQARLQQSKSQLAAAMADHRRMHKRLRDHQILAPFDAYIVSLETEIGQWVQQGDSVAQLVSIDTLEAWLDVPERFAGRLDSPNTNVLIRIPSIQSQAIATDLVIIPDADPLSRLFPVRAAVANSGHKLQPGMSIVGLVPTGQNIEVLTVHKDAVLRDDAGQFLYFDAGGIAMVARIEQLFPVGQRLAITSTTLKAGMNTITEGNERLYPSALLNIVRPEISQRPTKDD
jgi:RND family efflux transporter MFP subunit